MRNRRTLLVLVWIFSVVVWTLYRKFFLFPEIVEELILKPMVFVYPVLFFLYRFESITTKALGFELKNKKAAVIWGMGFGLFLTLEWVSLWFLRGQRLQFVGISIISIITNLIVSLATATSEEILYRGFLLKRIMKLLNSTYRANILVSFMFGLHHLGIALFVFNYQPVQLLQYIVLIVLSGFAYGFIFQKSKSLYAPIIAHTLWNFTTTFFR